MRFTMLLGLVLLISACSEEAAPQPAQGAGKPGAPASTPVAVEEHPLLRNPNKAIEKAPEKFQVEFDTTRGVFVLDVEREWSPQGADRLYNLVRVGYYNDVRFFRVMRNFVAQFGMHGNPAVNKVWAEAKIPADRVNRSNRKGWVSYAMLQDPNTRSNQLFINLKDNAGLDGRGFAPIGFVSKGMDVVEAIHNGYGDEPNQEQIGRLGNEYLSKEYPKLDAIRRAKIVTQ